MSNLLVLMFGSTLLVWTVLACRLMQDRFSAGVRANEPAWLTPPTGSAR